MTDRCPGAGFQLLERVGGDGADGMRPGTHYPIRNPGSQNGLAGAVAAGYGHQNRHYGIGAAEPPGLYFGSQVDQKLLLVGVRAFLVLEWRALFSPRIGCEYKPQRVRVILRHFVGELLIGGNGGHGSFAFARGNGLDVGVSSERTWFYFSWRRYVAGPALTTSGAIPEEGSRRASTNA